MFDTGYNSGLFIHFMVLLAQKVHPDPGGLSPFQIAKSAQYFKLALLNHSKNLGSLQGMIHRTDSVQPQRWALEDNVGCV